MFNYSWQSLGMCFYIFAFLGWLMETVLCSINEKGFVNRGFLVSPICPIYGFGMVFIIISMTPFSDNLIILFFGGMVLATVVEYITAFILELAFKTVWWDYSTKKFNIKGRVCLSISLCWGMLSVVMLKIVWPFILNFLDKISFSTKSSVLLTLTAVLCMDTIYSVLNALSFTELLRKTTSMRQVLKTHVGNANFFDSATEMFNILNLSHDEFVATIRSKIKHHSPNHLVLSDEEFKNRFNEIIENYENLNNKRHRGHKRLIKAFPNMKSKDFSESLNELKDKILRI